MTTSSPRLEGSTGRSRSARPLGVATAAAALGIAAFALASSLPESTVPTAFSPQWWPQVLSAILVVLGISSAIISLRGRKTNDLTTTGSGSVDSLPVDDAEQSGVESWSIGRLAGVLAATVAYILVWTLIGYAPATAVYTVALSALLGARGWFGLAIFPAIVTAFLVVFFDVILGVPL